MQGRARTLHSGCGRERRALQQLMEAFARDFACKLLRSPLYELFGSPQALGVEPTGVIKV